MTTITTFFWRKTLVFLLVLATFFYITKLCGINQIEKNLSHKNIMPAIDLRPLQNKTETQRATVDSKTLGFLMPQSLRTYSNRPYIIKGQRYNVLKRAVNYSKVGIASWYGAKFHGRFTATHEHYNLHGMTAASPNLPLPSYAKVTNLENGKQVVVKINDRGPFLHHRILDLSYAAAKKLNFVHQGLAKVKVETIAPQLLQTKSDQNNDASTLFAANDSLYSPHRNPPSLYPFLSGSNFATIYSV